MRRARRRHHRRRLDRRRAHEGEQVAIILDKTPFYGEMGGQVGDTGTISNDLCTIAIDDTKRPEEGLPVHYGTVVSGSVHKGDVVHAAIDARRRAPSSRATTRRRTSCNVR